MKIDETYHVKRHNTNYVLYKGEDELVSRGNIDKTIDYYISNKIENFLETGEMKEKLDFLIDTCNNAKKFIEDYGEDNN